jgi:transposase InsO family protein
VAKELVLDRNSWELKQLEQLEQPASEDVLSKEQLERDVQIEPTLSENQRQRMTDFVWEFRQTFATDNQKPRLAKVMPYTIEDNDQPVYSLPFRRSPEERKIIRENVQQMLDNGIIEECMSPYSSPIVLVPKRNSTAMRFCTAFNKLNKQITNVVWPLPKIQSVFDSLGGNSYFSSIDACSAYWQIPLDPKTKYKTAFTTPEGSYCYNRLPFGLKTSPAVYSRMMDCIFSGLKWTTCLTYLDDVLVFSRTFDEHMDKLRKVFDRIRQARLTLKLSKCQFAFREIEYLGQIVNEQGVRMSEARIKAIKEAQIPKTKKELQALLGLFNYYRKYIKFYARHAQPLTRLLKDDRNGKTYKTAKLAREAKKRRDLKPLVLDEKAVEAMNYLKNKLCECPILVHPDFDLPYVVATDACDTGLGAVLSQVVNGEERVVMYASRALSPAEKKWSVSEREALAIIWACEKFRPYVYGRKFTVVTDHHSLKWLKETKKPGRLSRWALRLQEYDIELTHKPGKKHGNADGPSRLPLPYDEELEERAEDDQENRQFCLAAQEHPKVDWIPNDGDTLCLLGKETESTETTDRHLYVRPRKEQMKRQQRLDPQLQPLVEFLEHGTVDAAIENNANLTQRLLDGKQPKQGDDTLPAADELKEAKRAKLLKRMQRISPRFMLKDGVLYRLPHRGKRDVSTMKLVIPNVFQQEYLSMFHDLPLAGHMGIRKMLQQLGRHAYWDGMRKSVKKWIRSCDLCQRRKSLAPNQAGLLQPKMITAPFRMWSMDILGPFKTTKEGNKKVLVLMDVFSRWLELIPLPSKEAEEVAQAVVERIICRFGVPEILFTDRGREFNNKLLHAMGKYLKIEHRMTSVFHPQANGAVERINRHIAEVITMYVNKSLDDWDKWLCMAAFAHNTSASPDTEESPFSVTHGCQPMLPADVIDGTLEEANLSMEQYLIRMTQNLNEARRRVTEARLKQADRLRRKGRKLHVEYKAGDEVLVLYPRRSLGKSGKLQCHWKGPVKIVSKAAEYSYEVQNVKGKFQIVHVSRLRSYRRKETGEDPDAPALDVETVERMFFLPPGTLEQEDDRNWPKLLDKHAQYDFVDWDDEGEDHEEPTSESEEEEEPEDNHEQESSKPNESKPKTRRAVYKQKKACLHRKDQMTLDQIVNYRVKDGRPQYRVKYPPKYMSGEDAEIFKRDIQHKQREKDGRYRVKFKDEWMDAEDLEADLIQDFEQKERAKKMKKDEGKRRSPRLR